MTREGPNKPRSPVKVAVMAFGATVLVGLVIAAIVGGIRGGGKTPFEHGEAAGRVITPIAVVAAVAAYFVQKRRLDP